VSTRSEQFLQSVVEPTGREYLNDLGSVRRGRLAAIVLNQMADYRALDEGTMSAQELRILLIKGTTFVLRHSGRCRRHESCAGVQSEPCSFRGRTAIEDARTIPGTIRYRVICRGVGGDGDTQCWPAVALGGYGARSIVNVRSEVARPVSCACVKVIG
jgi:hypothetical protein